LARTFARSHGYGSAPRAAGLADDLPTQVHHFPTNKNSVFTPRMKTIADRYGLSLDDAWNTARMPHLGRHPNAYRCPRRPLSILGVIGLGPVQVDGSGRARLVVGTGAPEDVR